jgi:hypothetical protein
VEIAMLFSAAKEGRASRAAEAVATRLPRAVRRVGDGSEASGTTALPGDWKVRVSLDGYRCQFQFRLKCSISFQNAIPYNAFFLNNCCS